MRFVVNCRQRYEPAHSLGSQRVPGYPLQKLAGAWVDLKKIDSPTHKTVLLASNWMGTGSYNEYSDYHLSRKTNRRGRGVCICLSYMKLLAVPISVAAHRVSTHPNIMYSMTGGVIRFGQFCVLVCVLRKSRWSVDEFLHTKCT